MWSEAKVRLYDIAAMMDQSDHWEPRTVVGDTC
jgi:hypothetical protein